MTRQEFADVADVSYSSVSNSAKSGSLRKAVVGKKLDGYHPVAIEYINRIRHNGTQNTPPPPQKNIIKGWQAKKNSELADSLDSEYDAPEQDKPKSEIPPDVDNITKYADMTLRQLIDKFGTDSRFAEWLKASKAIEDINEKRLKNATTEGQLVSKELVQVGVIDQINLTHTKLLTDCKKTIAARLKIMVENKTPQNEMEAFISQQISSFIRPMKSKIARALKNA